MTGIERAVALAAFLVLAGCTAPATAVERPRVYPDRTTPDATWRTFLWAWRAGDVPVLEQTYGLWLREELVRQVETQGRAAVSDYYKKDAKAVVIEDARWERRSDETAYLLARLGRTGEVPLEVRFAFLRRDDGWCIDGRKTLR
jgi:hypothetical protein